MVPAEILTMFGGSVVGFFFKIVAKRAENEQKRFEMLMKEKEAADKGLEIDHDDEHAAFGEDDFALLIHGTQPKGSAAADALKEVKRLAKLASA